MTAPKALGRRGLLTTREVAQKLGVHRTTVWLWINAGALRSERVGQFRAIRPSALADFVKKYNPKDTG